MNALPGCPQRDRGVLPHAARQGLQHPGPHRVCHRVRVHLRDQARMRLVGYVIVDVHFILELLPSAIPGWVVI